MLPAGVNMVAVVNNTVAIVVAVAGAVALIAILLAIGALIRTLATLRIAVEQLQRQTTPLVGDLQSAVQRTNDSLGRVDNILDNRYATYGTFFDTGDVPNFANGGAQFTDARSVSPARPRAFYAGLKATF